MAAGDPEYGTAIVDLSIGQEVGRLGGGFQFADLANDGRTLFIAADPANFGRNVLEAISTDTDDLQGKIELQGFPLWVDLTAGAQYGAALISGPEGVGRLSVSLFDPVIFAVTQTIPLEDIGSALWVAERPHTNEIYACRSIE